LSLSVERFLERFCLHILPPHFVKIRSYGLLSNRNRSKRIEQVRALMEQSPPQTDLWLEKAFEVEPAQSPLNMANCWSGSGIEFGRHGFFVC
jgi:hypothetical protein